jgi:hypothetical protein
MKLTVNTCYTRVLHLLCSGEDYSQAVFSMRTINGPKFEYEGMAGYIETEVEFNIRDLAKFTELWESWFKLTEDQKLKLYYLAKGRKFEAAKK